MCLNLCLHVLHVVIECFAFVSVFFICYRERIQKEMDIVSHHFSVKKKQAEEVINQLIGEVELAMSESKRLKDIYRTVKAGKTFNANTI